MVVENTGTLESESLNPRNGSALEKKDFVISVLLAIVMDV